MNQTDIKPGLILIDDVKLDMKSVQLFIQNLPILGLGRADKQHGEILEQILYQHSIPFEKFDLGTGKFYAQKKGQLYVVVGMGSADMAYFSDNKIGLYDNSSTYHLEPNQEHLDKMKEYVPELNITIDS